MRRWRRPSPIATDTLLAAAIAAIQITSAALVSRKLGEQTLTPTAVALLLGQAVPLVWRRRAPVPVWAITSVAAAAFGIRDYPDPFLPLGPLVALHAVVVLCPRRVSTTIGVTTLAAIAVATAAARDSDAIDYFVVFVSLAFTWALAENQRQRAVQAAASHAEDARRAVADERARIARELHDVVAHHVSMIVVQAEAGASVTSASPDQAVERFDAIGSTGRQALDELRRLLGVLRDDSERGAVDPQPGVADLDELVRDVQQAGLPVDVRVEGQVRALPAGLDLSVYRIVQEALTNTLKHAGPARASVALRYEGDAVEVEVSDDGFGPSDAAGVTAWSGSANG